MAFDLSNFTSFFNKGMSVGSKKNVLGIDIGSSAIKIVQLRDEKGVPTLDTYGELQLGPYGGVDIGRTTNLQIAKLSEALSDIVREASATSTRAAIAMSFNSSFTTVIDIPKGERENIANIMPVEARKYVPMPLSEVTLDWFPLPEEASDESIKVLLAAIHNDALAKSRSVIQVAELEELLIEIEVFSSIRASMKADEQTVGIIDMGANSTKLFIAEKGMVQKTHSLTMNGVGLTNALASRMGVSYLEAEELKRRVGLLSPETDTRSQAALTAVLERGFKEIATFLKRYEEEEGKKIEQLILSGSGAMLKGLTVYASDMLERPTVFADPFSKVAYPAFLQDTLKEVGPTFSVALGVALRGLKE